MTFSKKVDFYRMTKKVVLGLKLPTDPRWVHKAESNIEEVLTDHAWCEQKAASNAISVIVKYSQYEDLVVEMTRICNEEMEHFGRVHEKIRARGLTLGPPRKDDYVHDLSQFMMKGGNPEQQYVDHMLFAAMIEARSCERFRLLAEKIKDKDLAEFYRELMASEAEHYTTFIAFAKKYSKNTDVEKRWKQYLDFEASLMERYGKKEAIHG